MKNDCRTLMKMIQTVAGSIKASYLLTRPVWIVRKRTVDTEVTRDLKGMFHSLKGSTSVFPLQVHPSLHNDPEQFSSEISLIFESW